MLTRKSPFCRGFTLIELIVVIAILGVLAAVAYPTLSSMLGRDAITKCTANIRQLGIYGQKYSEDMGHRNILPCSGMMDDEDTEWGDESEGWWYSIGPMTTGFVEPDKKKRAMKLPTLFHCPKDMRKDVGDGDNFLATAETVSYVSWTDNSMDPEDTGSPIRMSKQRLDELPWLSDGNPVLGQSVRDLTSFQRQVMPAIGRHQNTIVVCYASGMLKAIELDPEKDSPQQMFKKIAPWLDEQGMNKDATPKPSKKKSKKK